MSKPKIRLQGFSGDWEETRLKDFTSRVVRKNTGLQSTLPLTVSAQLGLVGQDTFFNSRIASSNIEGYYLLKKGEFAYNKSSSQGYPYGAVKRLDLHENGVLSTLYIVFSVDKEKVDSDYVVSYFDASTWHNEVRLRAAEGARNHGLLNISADDFFDIKILLPENINEQQAIGAFFKLLDRDITNIIDKVANIKSLKTCYLSRLFPTGELCKPCIRLSGFTDEWVEKELGECFDERVERSCEGELLSVTIADGIKKFSELNRHDSSSEDKSNYKVVHKGDIVYNSMRMWQGASGCSDYDGIVSPAYTVLVPKEGIDPQFFACYFKNTEIIHKFRINSQGLTSDTWNLKYPAFSKIKIRYPKDIEEQRQIARFFAEMNRMISLHNEELDKFKSLKASYLEGMFV